jgi:vacuolar-type H+-ATPase subunit D/Vma8
MSTSQDQYISSLKKIKQVEEEAQNEIDKTKRKANAIENVFIPRLEAAIRFIIFRLEEMERDTFAMLKTVKRKMSEREKKKVEATVIAN